MISEPWRRWVVVGLMSVALALATFAAVVPSWLTHYLSAGAAVFTGMAGYFQHPPAVQ
jgi:hypothetical protein